jgi:hypothetical protein
MASYRSGVAIPGPCLKHGGYPFLQFTLICEKECDKESLLEAAGAYRADSEFDLLYRNTICKAFEQATKFSNKSLICLQCADYLVDRHRTSDQVFHPMRKDQFHEKDPLSVCKMDTSIPMVSFWIHRQNR